MNKYSKTNSIRLRVKPAMTGAGRILRNPVNLLIMLIMVQTACVKVDLNNTDHPQHGKITLATTWDNRGENVAIPAEYAVRTKHASSEHTHEATLQEHVNTLSELFPEGDHRIHIYNVADRITVSGTTATADYSSGLLGWLFTGMSDVAIQKDTHHAFSVPMQQQVRELTLELNVQGNAADRITGIAATLSGVAGAIDVNNGNPTGDPVSVVLDFVRRDAQLHVSTIRLLGITGSEQKLSLTLHFADGNPSTLTVVSDLSSQLAAFNADKKTPLTLKADIATTVSGLGITAEISDWTGGNNETVVAN